MRSRYLITVFAATISFTTAIRANEYRVEHTSRVPSGESGTARYSLSQSEFDAAADFLRHRHYRQAFDRFTSLATSGDTRAMRMLSLMHAKGLGRPANDQQAIAWLEKAANTGDAPAMLLLGNIYGRGLGVPADRDRGAYWLKLAHTRGAPEIRGQAGDALRTLKL